jgi:hypothetical protein
LVTGEANDKAGTSLKREEQMDCSALFSTYASSSTGKYVFAIMGTTFVWFKF